jgi:hypothetical protein
VVEVDGVGFAIWRALLAPGLRWQWSGWRGVIGLGGLCWSGIHCGSGGLGLGCVGAVGKEGTRDVEGGFGVGGGGAGWAWRLWRRGGLLRRLSWDLASC